MPIGRSGFLNIGYPPGKCCKLTFSFSARKSTICAIIPLQLSGRRYNNFIPSQCETVSLLCSKGDTGRPPPASRTGSGRMLQPPGRLWMGKHTHFSYLTDQPFKDSYSSYPQVHLRHQEHLNFLSEPPGGHSHSATCHFGMHTTFCQSLAAGVSSEYRHTPALTHDHFESHSIRPPQPQHIAFTPYLEDLPISYFRPRRNDHTGHFRRCCAICRQPVARRSLVLQSRLAHSATKTRRISPSHTVSYEHHYHRGTHNHRTTTK